MKNEYGNRGKFRNNRGGANDGSALPTRFGKISSGGKNMRGNVSNSGGNRYINNGGSNTNMRSVPTTHKYNSQVPPPQYNMYDAYDAQDQY